MAKKGSKVLNFVVWITEVLVALAVGFGLIGGTLSVPYIGIVNVIVGWIVVVITLLGVILGLLKL